MTVRIAMELLKFLIADFENLSQRREFTTEKHNNVNSYPILMFLFFQLSLELFYFLVDIFLFINHLFIFFLTALIRRAF